MCIANGMAMGADGNLYIVDEPLNLCVPDPKIVRLRLDGADLNRLRPGDVFGELAAITPVLTMALISFNFAVVYQEFQRGVRARRKNAAEGIFSALINLLYLAPALYEAGFVSSAHTAADIAATVDAAHEALKA